MYFFFGEMSEENYRDDLQISFPEDCGMVISVQVEVRLGWREDQEYPFETLQFPKSKMDNALYGQDEVWFLVFNNKLNKVAFFKVGNDTPKFICKKTNCRSPNGPEPFYNFSLDLVEFENVINDNFWSMVCKKHGRAA